GREQLVAAGLRERRLVIFGAIVLLMVVIGVLAPLLAPYAPYQTAPTQTLQQPSFAHLLGTDSLGRDQLSRVIYGTRISLAVAVIAVSISLGGGGSLGLVAGYLGGWLDQIFSRVIDALLPVSCRALALALPTPPRPSPPDATNPLPLDRL